MTPVRGTLLSALVLVPVLALAANGCRPAQGAQEASGGGAQMTQGKGATDPLDKALDRVDAARARLTAADAAAAAAMRDLDAALDDASRLGGGEGERIEGDCCVSIRGRSWEPDRVAWRAQASAMRAAAEAQREARFSVIDVRRNAIRSVATALRRGRVSRECKHGTEEHPDDSDPQDENDDSPDESQ